ncbi:MAG: ankyrin repeat domain-containing protein [Alphaproteobacteria bacterium]|nr:ankyrin repeat domain-containing protein [Alphaproteobacteria bacterium]
MTSSKLEQVVYFCCQLADKHRRLRIHLAVFSGNVGNVKKLIALGADPNIKNKSGRTPKEMAFYLNKSSANQNFEIAIKKRERRQEIIEYLTSIENR